MQLRQACMCLACSDQPIYAKEVSRLLSTMPENRTLPRMFAMVRFRLGAGLLGLVAGEGLLLPGLMPNKLSAIAGVW